MNARAVILERPERLQLSDVALSARQDDEVLVRVAFSGISTGTEKLLWSGRMPPFPGMGYPLVPGYEAVGDVIEAGAGAGVSVGQTVFVPGSTGFENVKGLFGASASHLVVPGRRVLPVDNGCGADTVLLALAATAHHAVESLGGVLPELIVGHGVLGRLIARLCCLRGGAPTVWEREPQRRIGDTGYLVIDAEEDPRRDYMSICDVTGDADIIDRLVTRLAPGGEIVLAGFYDRRVSFAFPAAFMKEARIRIAAEWRPGDLAAVGRLVEEGSLSLAGLVTHRSRPEVAEDAYGTAFTDPACLKMILDWRSPA